MHQKKNEKKNINFFPILTVESQSELSWVEFGETCIPNKKTGNRKLAGFRVIALSDHKVRLFQV